MPLWAVDCWKHEKGDKEGNTPGQKDNTKSGITAVNLKLKTQTITAVEVTQKCIHTFKTSLRSVKKVFTGLNIFPENPRLRPVLKDDKASLFVPIYLRAETIHN